MSDGRRVSAEADSDVCQASDQEKGGRVEPEVGIVASAPEYPEGGARAYLVVGGGVCVLFSSFGLANSFGVLQAHFEADQLAAYTPSEIAWIGGVQFFLLYVLALPNGFAFDIGYYQWQLACGSVLWVLGIFMLSLSTRYLHFMLSWGVLMGIAMGSLFSPTLSCIGTYFLKRRGTMLSTIACGAASGTICFPILLNHLIPRIGFAPAIRIVGYITLGLLAFANAVVRPRKFPPRPIPAVVPLLKVCLSEPSTWLICMGGFGVMVAFFFPIFFVQTYSRSHGANTDLADYTVAILNAASLPGRFLPGLLSDRFGVLNTAIPFVTITGLMVFVMLAATTTAVTLVFTIAFGFFSGAWVALQSPSFMSLSRNVGEIGFRNGLGLVFIGFSSLLGPPICGALIRATNGAYWSACVFAGGAGLAGSACLAAARWRQARIKGTWRV